MYTSSSNLTRRKDLSKEVLKELVTIADQFSTFQNSTALHCPQGCGKCCFKADIFCSPIELLPLAMDLVERGTALSVLEKCEVMHDERCMFLKIEDELGGKGKCTEYKFRPLICRAFGVSGTHDKKGEIQFSVCTTLKEANAETYAALVTNKKLVENIPYIDQSKNILSNIDPSFMEEEFPINKALSIILEKVLFYESMNS